MTEAFLYHIWQYKLFDVADLKIKNEPISIIKPGFRNHESGPDFFDARIKIGNTTWAGNVEIHVKTSDWIFHGHQNDDAYKNTILHVVFDDDLSENTINDIPVLELKNKISQHLLSKIGILEKSQKWIPCQELFHSRNPQIFNTWIERLGIDRLERKTEDVKQKLQELNGDFEWLLICQLFYYFGFKVNAVPMDLLVKSIPKKALIKKYDELTDLEAILFGCAGLLPEKPKDEYGKILVSKFLHYKNLYNLEQLNPSIWKFGGLRPPNFPTIRISQLAHLIYSGFPLFEKLLNFKNIEEVVNIFSVSASNYWNSHFVFDKTTAKSIKKNLGKEAISSVLINVLAPILFTWEELNQKQNFEDRTINLLNQIPPESNSIAKNWINLGVQVKNAFETQALLQLKSQFCNRKQCLSCAIGIDLIKAK